MDYLSQAEPFLRFLNELEKTQSPNDHGTIELMKTSILSATFSILGTIVKSNNTFTPKMFLNFRQRTDNQTWTELLHSIQHMQYELQVCSNGA